MDWNLRQRIEREYQRELAKLGSIFVPAKDQQGKYEAWQQRLMDQARITWFQNKALGAVRKMSSQIRFVNAQTWREAARKSMRGKMIYEALQQEMRGKVGKSVEQFVSENAELISTFPHNMAQQLDQKILKAVQAGVRHETIARQLRAQFPNVLRSRLNLIARTETSKCSTALTRARSEEIGADWWVWRTSKDQRVRESHRKMDTVLVSWHDLPSPEALIGEHSTLGRYAAGDCPNCRCYPEPLLLWTQVGWPHRVYHSGKIEVMSLAQFKMLGASAPAVAA